MAHYEAHVKLQKWAMHSSLISIGVPRPSTATVIIIGRTEKGASHKGNSNWERGSRWSPSAPPISMRLARLAHKFADSQECLHGATQPDSLARELHVTQNSLCLLLNLDGSSHRW